MLTKRKLLKTSLSAVLIGASSIVTPLVLSSCNNAAEADKYNALGGQYDKEYGIDEAEYRSLRNTYWAEYKSHFCKDQTPEQIAKAQKRVFRSFASIENARKTNNMSYTAMTESLIQMAASQGIKLKRSRTANWNDINVMFEGMKRSFADYMLNLKFSSEQIEKIKTIAQNEFNVIMHGDDEGKEIGLLEKYQNGDPLSAMMEAKKLLAICFADVNENIGLMAAATKLSQFLQDYTITFDDSEAKLNQNRLDILEAGVTDKDPDTDEEVTLVFNQDAKNADISPFMNRIFKVVRNRDKQEVKFSRHLLHGYKITPILKNISKNEFSNVYTLDIDWQCVKESYEDDPERAAATTAHIYGSNGRGLAYSFEDGKDEPKTVKEILGEQNTSVVSYRIPLTPAKEKEVLINTYLKPTIIEGNLKYIDFKWDTKDNAYEALFQGDRLEAEEGTESYLLNIQSLASAGLMISAQQRERPTNEEDWHRLDEYTTDTGGVIHVKDDREGQADNAQDELLQQFFSNCSLTSTCIITDADKHIASNQLHVAYNNTTAPKETTFTYEKEDTNNFVPSEKVYEFLVGRYNSLSKFVDTYAQNKFKDDLDAVSSEITLTSVFFSLTTLLNALCITLSIIFPPKAPWLAAILATAVLSQGCQSAVLGLYIDKKLNLAHHYDDKCEELRSSREYKNLKGKMEEYADKYGLIQANDENEITTEAFEAGYNTFKDATSGESWSKIKEAMDWFGSLQVDEEFYLPFRNKINQLSISPEDYQRDMKDWAMPNGKYFIATTSLDAISLGLDIANLVLAAKAPEAAPSTKANADADAAAQTAQKQSIELVDLTTKDNKYINAIEDIPFDDSVAIGTKSELREGGKIPGAEADIVDAAKDMKSLIPDEFYGKRKQYSNWLFALFYGVKDRWMSKDMDLIQKYGTNLWKLFKLKYGEKAAGYKNAFTNFFKALQKINPRTQLADFPFGPEAARHLFTKGAIIGQPRTVHEGVMQMLDQLFPQIKEAINPALIKGLDEAKSVGEYVQKLDEFLDGAGGLLEACRTVEGAGISSIKDTLYSKNLIGDYVLSELVGGAQKRYTYLLDAIYYQFVDEIKII